MSLWQFEVAGTCSWPELKRGSYRVFKSFSRRTPQLVWKWPQLLPSEQCKIQDAFFALTRQRWNTKWIKTIVVVHVIRRRGSRGNRPVDLSVSNHFCPEREPVMTCVLASSRLNLSQGPGETVSSSFLSTSIELMTVYNPRKESSARKIRNRKSSALGSRRNGRAWSF